MDWKNWVGLWIAFLSIGCSLVTAGPGISTEKLMNVFQSAPFDKPRDPISLLGVDTRSGMSPFLKDQFRGIATSAGVEFFETTFETEAYQNSQQTEVFQATNYILVFKGSNEETEDRPLAILANYDTDMNEPNAMDDNGSGVAALIVLAKYLAEKISTNKIKLERTVILAATDAAIEKYDYGVPAGAKKGGEKFVQEWLPNFLKGRTFAGAIVLDGIMNFDERPNSQVDSNEFSKAFPSAYQEMSNGEFKGDFLALVQRDDHLDNPLTQAFERGWIKSMKELKQVAEHVDPKLIKFKFTNQSALSPVTKQFLRSDQNEFWKWIPVDPSSSRLFPAILLTDTEKYRKTDCAPRSCTLAAVATPKNLAFLQRNVMAVYATVLEIQADPKHNGCAKAEFPTTTLLTLLAGIFFHHNFIKYN